MGQEGGGTKTSRDGYTAQWDPKYGCRGTVIARFAIIAFVAWKRLADSTLGKLLVHPEYS